MAFPLTVSIRRRSASILRRWSACVERSSPGTSPRAAIPAPRSRWPDGASSRCSSRWARRGRRARGCPRARTRCGCSTPTPRSSPPARCGSLAERGALRFTDRVADHVPGFEANAKGDITIIQLLSHQGGLPQRGRAERGMGGPRSLAEGGVRIHARVHPGTRVHYHGRAAHWTAAVLIEALTKTDYRAFIRENVIEPLGLGGDLFVGLPDAQHGADGGHARAVGRLAAAEPARGREPRRLLPRRHAGRRRLRDRPGHGRLLPDDGAGRHAERHAGSSRPA